MYAYARMTACSRPDPHRPPPPAHGPPGPHLEQSMLSLPGTCSSWQDESASTTATTASRSSTRRLPSSRAWACATHAPKGRSRGGGGGEIGWAHLCAGPGLGPGIDYHRHAGNIRRAGTAAFQPSRPHVHVPGMHASRAPLACLRSGCTGCHFRLPGVAWCRRPPPRTHHTHAYLCQADEALQRSNGGARCADLQARSSSAVMPVTERERGRGRERSVT